MFVHTCVFVRVRACAHVCMQACRSVHLCMQILAAVSRQATVELSASTSPCTALTVGSMPLHYTGIRFYLQNRTFGISLLHALPARDPTSGATGANMPGGSSCLCQILGFGRNDPLPLKSTSGSNNLRSHPDIRTNCARDMFLHGLTWGQAADEDSRSRRHQSLG